MGCVEWTLTGVRVCVPTLPRTYLLRRGRAGHLGTRCGPRI